MISLMLGWLTKPWTVDDNGAVDDENEVDTVSPTSKPQLADDGSERSILAVIDTFDHPLYLLGDTAHLVNFIVSMQHLISSTNPQPPPSTFVVTQYSNMFPYQKNESNTIQYTYVVYYIVRYLASVPGWF